MIATDFRVFCMALGFVVVTVGGEKLPASESAARVEGYAKLIDAFCREKVPEAFEVIDVKSTAPFSGDDKEDKFAEASRMARSIVAVTRARGYCAPHDLVPEGFTQSNIQRHWNMAQALANVEMALVLT